MEATRAEELLQAARREVVQRAGFLDASFDDVVEALRDSNADDEHDPEGHTIAVDRAMLDALRKGAGDQLARIDAAMQRVVDGSYGVCTSCGRPIPDARLEVLPTTSICVDCAQARKT